jgi:hypothetical protein
MSISRSSARRREFLVRTLAVIGCGMIGPMVRRALAADDAPKGNPMQDEFQKLLGWIGGVLDRPITDTFDAHSKEYAILAQLKEGWVKGDRVELLHQLTAQYGDAAGIAVERFLELNIRRDWAEIGKAEAHEGTEIEDFINGLLQLFDVLGRVHVAGILRQLPGQA